MAPLEFAIPHAADELLLRLVATFAGIPEELKITTGGVDDVKFKGEGGEALSGVTTATRAIAGASPSAAQLLGESPEDQAKVRACCQYCYNSI